MEAFIPMLTMPCVLEHGNLDSDKLAEGAQGARHELYCHLQLLLLSKMCHLGETPTQE